MDHFDVVIVGAGLSGIGAACHLRRECPGKTYVVLEARDRIGGTWDLFQYPGIRSDSDMYTLGYSFKPWTNAKAIADGPSILEYVKETAREYGVDRHIRYNHRVQRASWSTPDAKWTVEIETAPGVVTRISCGFLSICSGYYRYDQGFTPDFPGADRFKGRIVHPQKWTADVDYAGKNVVVIGSGATAVTLVPALAQQAKHVVMLQRSPTYILTLPSKDKIANGLRKILPAKVAYWFTRWKNVLLSMLIYQLSRRRPEWIKSLVRDGLRRQLGPDYDLDTHFKPRYNPWDQRLCLVPDGDMFRAIRKGSASVVTDHIETFTESGIRLRSGQELPADLIVTATGLELLALGGMALVVDGRPVDLAQTYTYKGMMLSGVPNLAITVGYTNASWTLKADLTSEYVCRLLQHMDAHGQRQCVPEMAPGSVEEQPFIDFSSSYVLRAIDRFPKQGSKVPWKLYQNYVLDIFTLRHGRVDDGVMRFSKPDAAQPLKRAA